MKKNRKLTLIYMISIMLISVMVISQAAVWAGDLPDASFTEVVETQTEPPVADENADISGENGITESTREGENETPDVIEDLTMAEEETSLADGTEDPAENLSADKTEEETTTTGGELPEVTAAEEETSPATEDLLFEEEEDSLVIAEVSDSENDAVSEYAEEENITPKKNAQITLGMPKLVSTEMVSKGIKITWEAVANADWYYIYRWDAVNRVYEKLTWTYNTYYTDKTAEYGKRYYYTVQAAAYGETTNYSDYILSEYDYNGIKGIRVDAVSNVKATNAVDGVKLTWDPVEGADWYYIYYWNKNKNAYVKFDWTYDTSYVDTKAKSGNMYYYAVQACAYGATKSKADFVLSSYDYKGVKGMYLTPVKSVTITPTSDGAYLSWKSISGADGYWLYWRNPGDTKWNYFKQVSTNVYFDKTAKTGKSYEYLVKPYAEEKNTTFVGYSKDSYGRSVTMTITGLSSMDAKAQYYTSSTNYLIMVDCIQNRFGIYTRSNGKWELYKFWMCTTGAGGSPTCKGVYTINYKGYSFGSSSYTCYYYSSFNGPYLIHSTKFEPGTFIDHDPRLGMSLSGGCVRLQLEHAKFVYDYIPVGTTVVTYAD